MTRFNQIQRERDIGIVQSNRSVADVARTLAHKNEILNIPQKTSTNCDDIWQSSLGTLPRHDAWSKNILPASGTARTMQRRRILTL